MAPKKVKVIEEKDAPSTSENARTATEENFKGEIKKSINLFLERVSVAGLEDVQKAKTVAEKCMWCVAFVVAGVGMVITCSHLAEAYFNPPIIYDDYPTAGDRAPFPNVTICSPEQIDKNKLSQMLVIPEKVRNLIQRKNYTLADMIDLTVDNWRTDLKEIKFDDRVKAKAVCDIIDATAPGNMFRKLIEIMPKCEDIFFACYFENRPFDCCQAARFSLYDNYLCYHISLRHVPEFRNTLAVTGGLLPDAVHEETSGLVINASIDWRVTTSVGNVTMDGFLVILGSTASWMSDPVAIPANADAIITLAPPTKVEEFSQCRPNHDLPNLKLYEYYDQDGTSCASDNFLWLFQTMLGCQMGLYNHIPDNGTQCSSMPLISAMRMFNSLKKDASNDNFVSQLMQINSDTKNAQIQKALSIFKGESMSSILLGGTGCLPLCNRWAYRVNSASYGYVHLREQTRWDRDMKNRSWSRIRVYFPESSYLWHKERKTNKYVAIADVGGVLGVYSGASMVTVLQFLAYGVYVCYVRYHFKKKIKKLNSGFAKTPSRWRTKKSNRVRPM